MSRAIITDTTNDLQTDSGGVLWSIVQGEQLEFPISLNFITNLSLPTPYTFEAVVMEGENVLNQTSPPVTAKASARQDTTLVCWIPTVNGAGLNWISATSYVVDNLVLNTANGLYYLCIAAVSGTTAPSADPTHWVAYTPNQVYVRFPNTLSVAASSGGNSTGATAAWTVQPTTQSNVYGFFELSVTEPAGGRYQRTWKPMRGLVEMLYSPTRIV